MRPSFWVLLAALSFSVSVQAAPPDACKLLTRDDVQTVLGRGFEYAVGGSSDYSECIYRRGKTEAAGILVLNSSPRASDTLKARAGAPGSKATPVNGLGDGAYRVGKNDIVDVWFGKGIWLVPAEVKGGGASVDEQLRRLAALVLSRMP